MAKLEIQNISHFYKTNKALDEISTVLNNGVVALIGPNGAGKSTLMNIIVGLLQPSEGQILLNNKTIQELGKTYYTRIGYCPQSPHFYDNFSAQEFLHYMGAMKGLDKVTVKQRTAELLEIVNLSSKSEQAIGTFSGGMRQRLGIAQAMLNDPQLLVLDEPTAGLDPSERIRFRNLLSQIGNQRIVVLATHIVSDVENIANQVLFLKNGRLIVDGTPEKILNEIKRYVWEVPGIAEKDLQEFQNQFLVSNIRKNDSSEYTARLLSLQRPNQTTLQCCATLEDAFLFHFHHEGLLCYGK